MNKELELKNYCTICDGEISEDQQEYVHSDPYGGIGDCHEACCPCTHDPEFLIQPQHFTDV